MTVDQVEPELPARIERTFSILEKVAHLSNHPQHNLAAAIVIRNRIVSFGYNRLKSDPFQARFGKNSESIFLHAEIHAIKNALRIVNVESLKRADMYVLRVMSGKQKWGMAKPCSGCMRAIAEFGIRHVWYTDNDGQIQSL